MRKRSQNRLNSSKTWLAATLASLMAVTASADSVEGIGLRGFDTFRGRNYLSLMGGAKLMAKADGGLNDQAGSNYMQYMSTQV